jgi:hypothetical protein
VAASGFGEAIRAEPPVLPVFAALVRAMLSQSLPAGDVSQAPARKTVAEVRAMMRDPRYHGRGAPRDPAYVAEVTKLYQDLYPNGAAQ